MTRFPGLQILLWLLMSAALASAQAPNAPGGTPRKSERPGVSGSQKNDGLLEPVNTKTLVYPTDADAGMEIDEALKQATRERKRVMLIFGADWCYDCHVLDRALHDGEAGKLARENFVLIHVDIGEGNKNLDLAKKYKTSLDKGVPAVAILKNDGRVLYSSSNGEFEAARKMMKKDQVAFLKRWKSSPPR